MSASDQQTPKPTLNFCKSTKDRSKDLHFSLNLKNIAAHNNMSPTVSECLPVYSPMTDLTMNLCDLSTSRHPGYGDTPKRRLSLASDSSTPTPLRPLVLDRKLSQELGCWQDTFSSPSASSPAITTVTTQSKTPCDDKSPFEMLEVKSAAFRRFQSMPVPFCGYDQSPQATSRFPRFSTDSHDIADSSPMLQATSRLPHFSTDSHHIADSSPMLPNFKVCSLADDDEDSQDSGVGFDKMAFDFEPSPPNYAVNRDEKENTPEKTCSFSLDDNSQDSGVYFEKDKLSLSSRRGLFRSPSDPSARLLASRSQSFHVRPHPITLKRQDRHDADDDTTPQLTKRHRGILLSDSAVPSPRKITPVRTLQRCQSEVFAKSAMSRSEEQTDLIGDYSKAYCLPLMPGKHQDLKNISADTLKKLLNDEFSHVVEKYIIIDCRYPYEYNAGHIKNAHNFYTKEEIMAGLSQHRASQSARKRTILIFHCEFSSERAPKLSRFVRNKDRDANKECYPSLHYPELYLLNGGYKAFFESHQDMCEPPFYKPMLHQDHNNDLRHFRAKSKSWAGEKSRCAPRTGLRF